MILQNFILENLQVGMTIILLFIPFNNNMLAI